MSGSILMRTLRTTRRRGLRVLAVQLTTLPLALIIGAAMSWIASRLVGGSLADAAAGDASGAETISLLTIALPLGLVAALACAWSSIAAVRVAAGSSWRSALVDALPAAPRWLGTSLVLVAAPLAFSPLPVLAGAAALLLVVPAFVALGAIARDPGTWGLRLALRRGLANLPRALFSLVVIICIGAIAAALALALFAAPVLVLAGAPPDAAFSASDPWVDWATATVWALLLGSALAALPLLVIAPVLTVAVHGVLTDTPDAADWDDDSAEAVSPTSELSAAVTALLGTPGEPSAQAVRGRLRVPPRSITAGRVPGPGVMQVAGVELPAGRATRAVDAPTLELALVDALPGAGEDAAQQLWATSEVLAAPAAIWQRLAAGFADTGLWPVLLPSAPTDDDTQWFELPARQEPTALSDAFDVAQLLRHRLDESLGGDSPLRDTSAIAASPVRNGELGAGTGRRADALTRAFDRVGPARLALVGVRRPAEIVHCIAWPGVARSGIPGDELVELLASWEERYGALLVALSAEQLTFAVTRPPATSSEAIDVVAEHHALCPDEAEDWGDDRTHALALVDAPVWQLSWS